MMLGDDGYGYELARILESNGIWRSWLGDSEYVALQPHLTTPVAWSAFMDCSRPMSKLRISLQLRVRALLYDKASACLFLESSTPGTPSSLDTSYLQLHADNVYFSLEQDIQDWARLQAEGSPAISSLQTKFGPDLLIGCISADDVDETGHGITESKQRKPTKTTGQNPLLTVKPKQVQNLKRSSSSPFAEQSDAILSSSGSRFVEAEGGTGETGRESTEETELWYGQWFEKNSFERMHQLAWRTAQQRLPFKEREACQRTPQGMAAYLACLAKVQRLRCIFKSDAKSFTERSPTLSKEDINFLPEVMFPWNCVPDNPVFSRKRSYNDRHDHYMGILGGLQLTPSQSPLTINTGAHNSPGLRSEVWSPRFKRLESMSGASGKFKFVGRRKEIFEEAAQHSFREQLVRIVAGAGFQGLKQTAIEILVQLATCHICKLGSILRSLVDNYRTHCSQTDLLKMFIRNSGCGDLARLMEYVKAGIRISAQQQLLLRSNQIQQFPLQLQMQQNFFQVQQESKLPQLSQQMKLHQQNLAFQHQQLLEKVMRRQALTPRASTGIIIGNRKLVKERNAGDINSDIGAESPNMVDPKLVAQSMPLPSQQHQLSWQQQQQQLAQLTQSHHPHFMQQFKQFSSMQLPSLQPPTMVSSKPHVKVEALHELIGSDLTIKQEIEDDREGVIGSPSKRKR